jgi:tRNA threonylcarbamoyladenosine biosynthesis protein TsaB
MKLFIIDSNPGCSFAAYKSRDSVIISRTADFMTQEELNAFNKSPDKLIQCFYHISAQPGVNLNDIDAVSVTIGPGPFTGIRVGLAIAKGIADSLDKKIIPVNNFELMLNRVKNLEMNKRYCVLIPAKLPEYYYSIREKNKEIKSGFAQIDDLNSVINNDSEVVGDFSDETIRNLSYFSMLNPKELLPEEETMFKLSARLFENGMIHNPGDIKPLYMKDFTFRT